MLIYPEFDPVLLRIGPLAIRWYGLMYLLGFLAAYGVLRHLARWRDTSLSKEDISDLIFYCVCGVILGGRLGYTLFYNFGYYLDQPLRILAVWEGGMSFHGGLLGVVVAALLFCRRRRHSVLVVADLLAAATPIGLGLGRLGNFINGELWGRVTDAPWGMVFPGAGPDPRHPSQLYEALLEGPLLFLVLWFMHRRKVAAGVPFLSFFLGYGLIRFGVEFFREPDAHLGLLGWGASMGQLLSIPMALFGLAGLVWIRRRGRLL